MINNRGGALLLRATVYKDWLCPVCDNYQETFAHIWECDTHHSILQDIIRDSRSHLKELINLHLLNGSFEPTRLKDLPFLWNIFYDPDDYSFKIGRASCR